jgi:hypothetical protein
MFLGNSTILCTALHRFVIGFLVFWNSANQRKDRKMELSDWLIFSILQKKFEIL